MFINLCLVTIYLYYIFFVIINLYSFVILEVILFIFISLIKKIYEYNEAYSVFLFLSPKCSTYTLLLLLRIRVPQPVSNDCDLKIFTVVETVEYLNKYSKIDNCVFILLRISPLFADVIRNNSSMRNTTVVEIC